MFSSGRIPVRHPQVDLGLPTIGTGKYEWRGFLPQDKHPHGTRRRDGAISTGTTSPRRGWQAADDQWGYGSVHRSELLQSRAATAEQTHTLASTVGAMNRAATQDLRRRPGAAAGSCESCRRGRRPSARAQEMLDLMPTGERRARAGSTPTSTARSTPPGRRSWTTAWPKFADAVMGPVLGPQLGDLASLMGRDNKPNNQGSAFNSGWYGYVEKDLRSLPGRRSRAPFKTRFCGEGDLAACRDSLWAALDQAAVELEDETGSPNPADWRSDARPRGSSSSPGFLPSRCAGPTGPRSSRRSRTTRTGRR